MEIDDNLISYLEDLSYLYFSDEEKFGLKKDLSKILNAMACLNELNTENAAECNHPFDKVNAFREDEVKPSFMRELILKNAPKEDGEMFIAPWNT